MDNINDILNQIETIKEKMNRLQEELTNIQVYGEDENSLVRAISNGKGKILDYEFSEKGEIDTKKKKALIEATNNCIKKAKELEAEKKQEIVGNVNIPDIPGLF